MISFEEGIPTAINGEKMDLLSLIIKANEIAGRNGYGRIDMIEDRVVGIKSRECYECPAALLLIQAHQTLEQLCLDAETLKQKAKMDVEWASTVYRGLWFSQNRNAIDAYNAYTQKYVIGDVRIILCKGGPPTTRATPSTTPPPRASSSSTACSPRPGPRSRAPAPACSPYTRRGASAFHEKRPAGRRSRPAAFASRHRRRNQAPEINAVWLPEKTTICKEMPGGVILSANQTALISGGGALDPNTRPGRGPHARGRLTR